MQGFRADQACMDNSTRFRKRRFCLRPVREPAVRPPGALPKGTTMMAAGIRLTRGKGWEWSSVDWDAPHVVLSGQDPGGCVDRRPEHTGYDSRKWRRATPGGSKVRTRNPGCEFDGRLSLVRLADRSFRLYARSNL
eukprot:2676518-Prymnesium_polylepis.1